MRIAVDVDPAAEEGPVAIELRRATIAVTLAADAAPRAGRRLPPERRVSDDGREVERRVVAVLDGLGVPYELQPIDPAFADTAAYCERYGVPLDRAANTLVVAAKKEPRRYAACVVKATTRLDVNRAVRRLLDASARLVRLRRRDARADRDAARRRHRVRAARPTCRSTWTTRSWRTTG